MTDPETTEAGGEYFIDDSTTNNAVGVNGKDNNNTTAAASSTQRKGMIAMMVVAGILLLAAAVLGIRMLTQPAPNTTIYSIDSSRYGVPDECENLSAYCTETEDGEVKCSCGDYLYVWDFSSTAWVIWSSDVNNGGE